MIGSPSLRSIPVGRRRDRRPAERGPDRGQAAVFVVLVAMALFVLVGTGLTTLGRRVVERARAQSAADAAALASAAGDRAAADELAAAAGGTVASWSRLDEDTVVVTVRLGAATVTASASVAP